MFPQPPRRSSVASAITLAPGWVRITCAIFLRWIPRAIPDFVASSPAVSELYWGEKCLHVCPKIANLAPRLGRSTLWWVGLCGHARRRAARARAGAGIALGVHPGDTAARDACGSIPYVVGAYDATRTRLQQCARDSWYRSRSLSSGRTCITSPALAFLSCARLPAADTLGRSRIYVPMRYFSRRGDAVCRRSLHGTCPVWSILRSSVRSEADRKRWLRTARQQRR